MDLSPEWEQIFSEYCEIEHWSRIGDADTPDELILQWAKESGQVILTNDLDFGAILAATHLDKRTLAVSSYAEKCRESVQLSGPGILDVRDLIQTEPDNPFIAPDIREPSRVLNSLAGCLASSLSKAD